jgi:glycyl-tRNA synthetase beta chain
MVDSRAGLLIEVGCEDLPAASVLPMAEHLGKAISDVLIKAGLTDSAATIYATPRRIAASWNAVGDKQADQTVERRGPSAKAAYTDGEPSKALLGFLKSANATLDDVSTIETPKGEWLVVSTVQAGKSLSDIIDQAIPDVIKTMPMPKRMRWADKSHEFLRPVVWFTAMHGTQVLPISLFDLNASNTTLGHRFHSPEPIKLDDASSYAEQLSKHKVIPGFEQRKQAIDEAVKAKAAELGGTAVSDTALLDEVTALVEWPVIVAGTFEDKFLEIPKEALIQTMQENQRYYAVLDSNDELLPAFITIANLESHSVQSVIDGNERVIRPRFADTMFFWDQDKQKKLSDHQASLDSLLFQEKLGSVADKVARMQAIGRWLAEQLGESVDESTLAASLCKCDLNTEIVKELAKMQGIAGRYYAARDGHSEAVSAAMEEHYFPKQAGGVLPEHGVSQVVSIADKIDTLVGIYGLGMKPSGAKDPFGLRRCALGIVRILIEKQRDINLDELIAQSIASYGNRLPNDLQPESILEYVLERFKGYAQDQGFSPDVIEAVLAKSVSNPMDIMARLTAIKQFRATDAAESLAAASKRSGNILKKATDFDDTPVNDALLVEPAERALYEAIQTLQPKIESDLGNRDYQNAMMKTSELRTSVDTFFDDVMVNTDDKATRDNRLALLKQLNALCSCTAELSQLQPDA